MKTIHFLGGLPRSGSTLLAAILNQHPKLLATTTSGLMDTLGAVAASFQNNPTYVAQRKSKDHVYKLMRGLLSEVYSEVEKPIILDKSRGWNNHVVLDTMRHVLGRGVKVVATVRNIPDCAASFVRIAKPVHVKDFLANSPLISHLKSSYVSLQDGVAKSPESFCLIDYDSLLQNPAHELKRVTDFLSVEDFEFDFDRIDGSVVEEDDEAAWNIKGLHSIHSSLRKREVSDTRELLGDFYSTFLQDEFWNPDRQPRPLMLLDLQREANMRGDFAKGWEIAEVFAATEPDNDRAAFNRGWHLCHQGKLSEGIALMDRGRSHKAFGNENPGTAQPVWNGEAGGTVLLSLEGGLGDQIHSVRYARTISRSGCKVVVAGAPDILPLIKDCEGVSAACVWQAGPMTYHDFWVSAMSAPALLKQEWNQIDGRPYIHRQNRVNPTRFRVGLRWRGNPNIEEDVNRVFPERELFAAVETRDIEFVCLQRDTGLESVPEWVERTPLDTWLQTKAAVASCDLVISSCTSVAHLAGAMGVPTWIIVPVMPYYLWALPGDTTPWYDSVRLYRQERYGCWDEPIARIGTDLRVLADGARTKSVSGS